MTGKCVLSAVLFFVIKKGITDRPSPYLSFQCFCIQQKDHSCDSHYRNETHHSRCWRRF